MATAFAVSTGVGEAWHLVPGNGHYVEVGGRNLSMGVPLFPDNGRVVPRGSSVGGQQLPSSRKSVRCPICNFWGQGKLAAYAVFCELPLPIVDELFDPISQPCRRAALRPFEARAPPWV
jgi:hypothetical protein